MSEDKLEDPGHDLKEILESSLWTEYLEVCVFGGGVVTYKLSLRSHLQLVSWSAKPLGLSSL